MSKKLTKGGTALIVLGGILALIGLVLFLRIFFTVGRGMDDPFLSPFRMHALRSGLSFEGGVVGLVLLGVGSYMVKVGLGLALVGQSDSIASWLRRLVKGEGKGRGCPSCGASVSSSAKYCSQCGRRLE